MELHEYIKKAIEQIATGVSAPGASCTVVGFDIGISAASGRLTIDPESACRLRFDLSVTTKESK